MGSTTPTLPRKNALEVGIDPGMSGYERTALPIRLSRIPKPMRERMHHVFWWKGCNRCHSLLSPFRSRARREDQLPPGM